MISCQEQLSTKRALKADSNTSYIYNHNRWAPRQLNCQGVLFHSDSLADWVLTNIMSGSFGPVKCHPYNYGIAYYAKDVRNLPEEEKSPDSSKYYLCIVIY